MNQNNNNQRNILFYSDTCQTCQTLMHVLNNENLIRHFELIKVNGNTKYWLSQGITHIPTMIVATIKKPLVGSEPFNWIKQVKFMNETQTTNNANKRIIQQNMSRYANNKINMLEFVKEEMTGVSDGYAYTVQDDALPKNYVNAKQDNSCIFTAPEYQKLKPGEQKKMIAAMEKDRDDQENRFHSNMRKLQIMQVMKAEENEKR